MHCPDFTREYIDLALSKDFYRDEFKEILKKTADERRIYKGTVIPMTYQGIFFSPEDLEVFKYIIDTMMSIGRKMTDQFIKDPDFRRSFNFSKELEELILLDQGDPMPVPVGRYDIFYEGAGKFKFCELNTDGSSAMNEDRVLSSILLKSSLFKEMGKKWDIKPFELFDSLVVRFLDHYKKIRGREAETVAIVDILDKGTLPEFFQFKKAFENRGVKALVSDARELVYEDGRLMGKDEDDKYRPIDLVYRRLVTSDFLEARSACKALEDAYRDRAILMLGGFRSQIMHAKTCFSVLSSDKINDILSPEEVAFVRDHVPYTAELVDENDKQKLIDCKDDYILKPYNSYASQGIYMGRDYKKDEWAKIIKDLPFDQYIYQDFVEENASPVLEIKNNKLQESGLGHVIGLFTYCEEFTGSYTRFGRQGIISGASSYYSAPAFFVTRK